MNPENDFAAQLTCLIPFDVTQAMIAHEEAGGRTIVVVPPPAHWGIVMTSVLFLPRRRVALFPLLGYGREVVWTERFDNTEPVLNKLASVGALIFEDGAPWVPAETPRNLVRGRPPRLASRPSPRRGSASGE